MPTGNVSFIFQENILLTLFLEDVFRRIPHSIYGLKDFLEAVVDVSSTKNYKMIQEKTLLPTGTYENILEIFQMYRSLYHLHFSLQKEINLLRDDISHISEQKAFLSPQEEIEDEKKLKVFST